MLFLSTDQVVSIHKMNPVYLLIYDEGLEYIAKDHIIMIQNVICPVDILR